MHAYLYLIAGSQIKKPSKTIISSGRVFLLEKYTFHLFIVTQFTLGAKFDETI